MSTTMPLADAALREAKRRHAILLAQSDVSARNFTRDEIVRCVCERAIEAVGARVVAVARPDRADLVYHIGAGPFPATPIRVHGDTSLTGLCYRERRSMLVADVARDSRSSPVAARMLSARSLMLAPIVGSNAVSGVLMATSDQPGVFWEEDLQALEVLAGIIASAIATSTALAESRLLVAERAAAMGQLEQSDALFRALTEYSDELVSILSRDGTIRYSSPSFMRLLGYKDVELAGKRPTEFVHDDDRPLMVETFNKIIASPAVAHPMIVRLRHKDGSWKHVEGVGRNLLHVPAVRGVTCNARDVTARVEANHWLEFQAKLLATVEQAVISTDMEGRITYWSAFADRLYGWRAAEVIGKTLKSIIVAPAMTARANEIMAQLHEGRSWSGEFEVLRRDGTSFLAYVSDTPILDSAGRLAGVVGVSMDITERRDLEVQLRQALKMEAIGQLAGGVAHDFNNMLTAIIGYSELALLRVPSGEVHDDLVEIRQASERAADLTRQLLAFSRKQVLRIETVDLAGTVRGMDKMLRRLIRENIALSYSLPDDPVLVDADRTQLEQIVLNLVVNARDAMPNGGKLGISVELSVDEAGGRALLGIRDTGCGMSEAVKQRLFEPFFTTKPEGQGTGLGLAVVFGIVQQLGGTIQVESQEGVGSHFTIALPLSHSSVKQDAVVEPEPQRGSETVLLVEDNEALAAMSDRMLRSLGYKVLRASNGAVAANMDLPALEAVDVVVTDVVMPELDGPALVQRLAARGLEPAVVYMSGYTHGAALVSAKPDRHPRFIAKPWTLRELSVVIRKALDERSDGASTAPRSEEPKV